MEHTPLQMNRALYAKLAPYFVNCSISNQRQRSIFKDFKYTINLVCSAHTKPPLFLYIVGLVVFSDRVFAINLRKAANLFQYSKTSIRNFMNKRRYQRLGFDSSEIPINFTEIPHYRKWAIFKIPEDDILSSLFRENQSIYVKEIKDAVDNTKNDFPSLATAMMRTAETDTYRENRNI